MIWGMTNSIIFGVPAPFLMTALMIELTPGPNMTYLAVVSLGEGKRAGLFAVAGVALGLLISGLVAALGLAAVISESPFLFQLLRWGGVFYLIWLAYQKIVLSLPSKLGAGGIGVFSNEA